MDNHLINPGLASSELGRLSSQSIFYEKDKTIEIDSENFPKVDMRSLANFIKSLMSNEWQIKNIFFGRENSGFHTTEKVVMETPNPWPQVFFIFFVFFTVIMMIYFIIKDFT